MSSRLRIRYWLVVLFLGSLLCGLWFTPQATSSSAPQWVQQGVDRYQAGDYSGAIALWQNALKALQGTPNTANEAIVRENLARAHQQLGQSDQAIAQWTRVVQLYRQLGDQTQLGRALTEQAQMHNRLGQYRKAIAVLCNAESNGQCSANSAVQLTRTSQDEIAQVAALGNLGNAYRLIGEYDLSQKNLQASLEIAEQIQHPASQIAARNSLGTLYNTLAQVSDRRARSAEQSGETREAAGYQQDTANYDRDAIKVFQQAATLAQQHTNQAEQLRSLQGMIPAYYRTQKWSEAKTAWETAVGLLRTLPDSRDRVFAAIDLAQLLQTNPRASRLECLTGDRLQQSELLLQQAVAVARRIGDGRATSFALGELGQIFECRQQWTEALTLSQQARLVAEQSLDTKDSLYLWEWQTGRILRKLQREPEAIAAYERAIATLESIRGDLLTTARDIQFDFRDTIEPIYRGLVQMKLAQETPIQVATKSLTQSGSPRNFRSILRTINDLKLAELQNYFGNDCVIAAVNQESIDLGAKTSAAIFNTIILGDRTAVIISLPNGQQLFDWLTVPDSEITAAINRYRLGLEDARFDYDPAPAQKIYNWLVRPFEPALQQSQVNTLVFVQDGIFRTVPMAALHDGRQFLIQKYAVATTPSLTLTDPKALNRTNLRVLALGLTQATNVEGITFPALPNVAQELAGIRDLIPGSKKLVDTEFTRDRLKQELSETVYPILHVASHGKFATDPKDTFIITGDAQKLTFNELDRLIRGVSRNTEPLELLALTACETAVGNDRSALGLAGVAVQAGARSAIASLWAVNDAATAKLSTEFYAQLRNPQLSKAAALQSVQRSFLEGKITVDNINAAHPAYWSAFTLIGNWL